MQPAVRKTGGGVRLPVRMPHGAGAQHGFHTGFDRLVGDDADNFKVMGPFFEDLAPPQVLSSVVALGGGVAGRRIVRPCDSPSL